ncbi:MAG: hypothetical protein ACT4O1_13815 [Gemmatimonadota bacterium]
MYRTVSNLVLTLALAPVVTVAGAQQANKITSSEIAISRDRAEIKLELDDGRRLTLATVAGAPRGPSRDGVAGTETITLGVERGDAVDRSWRDLLNQAMEADATDLAGILRGWKSPAEAGGALDEALEAALSGSALPATTAAATALTATDLQRERDSLAREVERLKEQRDDARDDATSASRRHGPDWLAPLRHVARGIIGIFSLLITYAVLFGLGFVLVMFGGRKYIEGVADTVRAGVGRAFLVGLAGSFLLIPVFVLGAIALVISIVGIPALLIWLPLFPIATLLAILLGYIGAAHAAGERWAERHYNGTQWVSRANSYYYMAAGLALFSAFFIAANVITMAGPWLGFINNILNFLGVIITWAAATTGFGAVLISRGGSRPNAAASLAGSPYTEDARV